MAPGQPFAQQSECPQLLQPLLSSHWLSATRPSPRHQWEGALCAEAVAGARGGCRDVPQGTPAPARAAVVVLH